MDRARQVLKVGVIAAGVLILVLYLDAHLTWLVIFDLAWKVLVLFLLADISFKLSSRDRANGPVDRR